MSLERSQGCLLVLVSGSSSFNLLAMVWSWQVAQKLGGSHGKEDEGEGKECRSLFNFA